MRSAFTFVVALSRVAVLAAPVGSFRVGDGPYWGTSPPTYSCVQACAYIFGDLANYECSTSSESIDNQAHIDGFGDETYCEGGQGRGFTAGENFAVCTAFPNSPCGYSTYGAYSALVTDHTGSCGNDVNYCYASSLHWNIKPGTVHGSCMRHSCFEEAASMPGSSTINADSGVLTLVLPAGEKCGSLSGSYSVPLAWSVNDGARVFTGNLTLGGKFVAIRGKQSETSTKWNVRLGAPRRLSCKFAVESYGLVTEFNRIVPAPARTEEAAAAAPTSSSAKRQ